MFETLPILLQLCDSQFPSGAFAHSGGLEGLLDGRSHMEDEELAPLLRSILEQQVLPCDGHLGRLAHRAAGDLTRVVELDRELFARKATRELREASVATGRSFLSEAAVLLRDEWLDAFCDAVDSGASPGNYAITFHATAAVARIGEREAVAAYAAQACAQMTSVLMRLGVAGHRQAQRLLARLAPALLRGVEERVALGPEEAASFAPRLEIASMRHERQYSRLFRS